MRTDPAGCSTDTFINMNYIHLCPHWSLPPMMIGSCAILLHFPTWLSPLYVCAMSNKWEGGHVVLCIAVGGLQTWLMKINLPVCLIFVTKSNPLSLLVLYSSNSSRHLRNQNSTTFINYIPSWRDTRKNTKFITSKKQSLWWGQYYSHHYSPGPSVPAPGSESDILINCNNFKQTIFYIESL